MMTKDADTIKIFFSEEVSVLDGTTSVELTDLARSDDNPAKDVYRITVRGNGRIIGTAFLEDQALETWDLLVK